jgi:hypothetical protein
LRRFNAIHRRDDLGVRENVDETYHAPRKLEPSVARRQEAQLTIGR